MGIADKWKKRKIIEQAPEVVRKDPYSYETVYEDKPKRKWGRKKIIIIWMAFNCQLNKNKASRVCLFAGHKSYWHKYAKAN